MIIKDEQFQDKLARLFPQPYDPNDKVKCMARNVTFQVTDACNLCCFVKGTKVLMSDFTLKNIEDIKVGDYVIAFNPNTRPGTNINCKPTKVTHTFYRHSHVRQIETQNHSIICTDEHPFFTDKHKWKRADNLTTRSYVETIPYIDNWNINVNNMDYCKGYLIGFILGDSNVVEYKNDSIELEEIFNGRSSFPVHNNFLVPYDISIIEAVSSYLKCLGVSCKVKKYSNEDNKIEIQNSKDSQKINKLISDNLNVNDNPNYLAGYLAGIIDTQGLIGNELKLFSNNTAILKQAATALDYFGVKFRLLNKYKVKNKYTNALITKSNPKDLKILELVTNIKNKLDTKNYNYFYGKDIFSRERILYNKGLDYIDTVYNIETEDHTYVANGFAVHNCTYCYQHNKGHHSMPFDVAKRFIDMLLDAKDDNDNEYVNMSNSPGLIMEFIGGEPFLEIDLIDQITDYFIQQMILKHHPWATKYMISICSNGVLYFDPKVQAYLDKHKNHLSFSVTVDGNKELHDKCRIHLDGSGSYDEAIAAVKDWVSRGYHMGSKMTIAPDNVEYTFDAVKSIIETGYDNININCVFEKGWTSQHALILYNQLKQIADYMIDNNLVDTHRVAMFDERLFKAKDPSDNSVYCGGNGQMIAVDYKGDIFPCLRYMESSLGDKVPPIIIGNVYDGIMTKQCEKDCVHCMRSITRRSESTDECFYCPIAEGCAECAAYNYEAFGELGHRATFICIMHKARALANVYFWNKWYRKNNSAKRFKNNVPDEWALEVIDKEELEMLKKLESEGEKIE